MPVFITQVQLIPSSHPQTASRPFRIATAVKT
jgi:hypothetical protein